MADILILVLYGDGLDLGLGDTGAVLEQREGGRRGERPGTEGRTLRKREGENLAERV